MEVPASIELLYEHGTLVAPDLPADEVLGSTFVFDDRTRVYRAPAWRYRDVVMHLRREKLTYADRAKQFEPLPLVLKEATYPAVYYVPRSDADMSHFARTDHHTTCPYKGEASYYTLTMDGDIAENVAWSYETPYDTMEAIAGRIAFYADRVEVYDVDDARVNPHHRDELTERDEIGDIVQHTDAGDGASQRPHWPTNVEGP